MIRISRFITDLFDDPRISIDRLFDYAEDNLQRIKTTNPANVFDGIIANTETKLQTARDKHTAWQLNVGQREGETTAVGLAIADWKKQARKIWKYAGYIYDENPQKMETIFPQGLEFYTDIDLNEAEGKMDLLVARLAANSADFVAGDLTDLDTIVQNFKTVRGNQQTEKGEVSSARNEYYIARKALTLQLSVNVHTVAIQYPGDEAKTDVYFDQSLLFAPEAPQVETLDGPLDVGETATVDYAHDMIDLDTEITLLSPIPGVTVMYWFAQNAGDEPSGNLKTEVSDPNTPIKITANQIGFSSTNQVLQARNLSQVAGKWEIEV